MKTMICQSLVFTIALILSGTNAFAAASTDGTGRTAASMATDAGPAEAVLGTGDNTMTINLSKGVALQYAGANSPNNVYSVGALHISGNREFATDQSTSGVWWRVCTAVSAGASACGTGAEPLGGAAASCA